MQMTEQENRVFHASRTLIMLEYIIITILAFIAIRLIVNFSFLFPVGGAAFLWLRFYWERLFPVNYVLVAVVTALCLYGRIASVSVSRAEVTIKKGFHKPIRIPMDSCRFVPHKKLLFSDYKIRLFYLRAINADGVTVDYRMCCFTEDTFSGLLSAINAYHTAALASSDVRFEMAYEDFMAGVETFHVMRNQIAKKEWTIFAKYSAILFVTALVILLIRSWGSGFQWYLVQFLVVCMLLSLPVMAVRLIINIKKCPCTISRNGAFLYFDSRRFSLGEINQVMMTDVRATSDSIFPLNRYISVFANGKKYKYWLGSEACLTAQEYQGLCREIERLFINTPFKIVYKMK